MVPLSISTTKQRRDARHLERAGAGDARRDLAAAFRRRRQDEVGRRHRADLDVEVDAVEEWPRQPRLIVAGAAADRAALDIVEKPTWKNKLCKIKHIYENRCGA
jgi:hypothetical protein